MGIILTFSKIKFTMTELEPSSNPVHYKWGIFYFNPADSRSIVPKREKAMGWTFNFSKARVYLVILLSIAILVGLSYVL
jgi:uncharacterized membrane protein